MNKLLVRALQVAARGEERNFWVGAAALRTDGRIVTAKNGRSQFPHAPSHAEARLIKKLGPGATVVVARLLKNGNCGLALPCTKCRVALRNKGVKNVYYTTETGLDKLEHV